MNQLRRILQTAEMKIELPNREEKMIFFRADQIAICGVNRNFSVKLDQATNGIKNY